MAKSDTARLEEVKTLLHQLQQISSESGNAAQRGRPEGAAGSLPKENTSPARGRKPLMLSGAALLIVGAAAGAWFVFGERVQQNRAPRPQAAAVQPSMAVEPLPWPSGTPEPHPEADAVLPLLQQAQQMMLGGDISGARVILMRSADAGPPDVALALARSYDPNFLRSVTNPNAAADIEQATLWYRRWHNAAVQNGQITDTLRLDRILRSMQ